MTTGSVNWENFGFLVATRNRLENGGNINGKLFPKKTPMPEGCDPELDESPLLDEKGTRK